MKKVLIVANLFHASPRIPSLSNYLVDFGYDVTIVTPPIKEDPRKLLIFPKDFLNKVNILEVDYKGDIFWFWRKIFSIIGFNKNESILNQVKEKTNNSNKKSFIDNIFYFYQSIFAYPDTEKTWIKPALKKIREILKKEKFDIIISSSPFPSVHVISSKIKKEFNIPWIADFRDLWTQNHNYPYLNLRRKIEEKFEIKILSSADFLVTTSEPMAINLSNLHKSKKVFTIINGFNLEKINEEMDSFEDNFTITYTGQIYTGKQDPLKFLNALKELIEEEKITKENINVNFYGPKLNWLEKKIKNNRLEDIVKQHGIISREESLKKQYKSHILLFFKWEDVSQKGVYSGKIFEYLGSKRFILATGGTNDVVSDLLKETKAGVDAIKIKEIKNILFDLYLQYKENKNIKYSGDWEKIKKHSQYEMAKKFAEILNKLTKNGR